jgi:hypothetical protein
MHAIATVSNSNAAAAITKQAQEICLAAAAACNAASPLTPYHKASPTLLLSQRKTPIKDLALTTLRLP